MKYLIALTAVLAATAALPAPFPDQEVSADDLQVGYNSSRVDPRVEGLIGFASGNRGGSGGAVFTVFDAFALRDALNSASPRIIQVRGRIDLTQLFNGSPGVNLRVGPFKTIIGGDRNAEITGGGFYLNNQQHVIIQDLKFTNCISYAPREQPNGNGGILSQVSGAFSQIDCVDINESEFIWVDHCEFSDDPWNANNTPENRRRHNGLVTVKRRSSYVSVSNNIFRNHNMNFLIGHNDGWTQDSGRLRVTVYQNWFRGTIQRNPMVRFGQVHVLNNLYSDISSYGIGIYTNGQVVGERNVFINTRRAWAHPVYNQPGPNVRFRNINNLLINSAYDSNMPSNVNWEPSQYYRYSPMSVNSVEAYVRRNAGPR